MNITEKRTKIILDYLINKGAEYCSQYGERGYSDPEKGIIFNDWNDISQNVQDYLEECGFALEWQDEWLIDYDYDKAYRTSPDSYDWEPSYTITDGGELLTPDDDLSDWLDEYALTDYNQPVKCLPRWVNLSESDFMLYNSELYESGFHYGQNDNPEKIAKKLFEAGAEKVLFQKVETSQFYIKFNAYYIGELV